MNNEDIKFNKSKDGSAFDTQSNAQDSSNPGEPELVSQEARQASGHGPDDLKAQLEALQAKADDHWQQYLRMAAELENVRKRAIRDVENAHKYGQEKLALDVLSVRDSMTMGLEAAKDTASVESLFEGTEMTMKLLNQVLERHGVKEINPEGQPFNPEFHEAMSVVDAPGVEPNTVVQVVQAGFEINGRLLRPARVLVSRS